MRSVFCAQRDATYSLRDEETVRAWIEQTLCEELEGKFYDALRDGSKLCALLNALQPGLIADKHTRPKDNPIKQVS